MAEQDLDPLIRFLEEHHVLSLGTQGKDGSYSTPMFYVPVAGCRSLLFLSEKDTRHVLEFEANPRVSAGIYLETRRIGHIQGLQILGTVEPVRKDEERRYARIYYKAFPMARALRTLRRTHRFYLLRIRWAKLTDNRIGFGRKMVWEFT